ncbi:DUF1656 domain-containing protein [Acidimangrovimonas sediminis]|uniref:DUF1656 domain-containing protein n=1 Tax=Acidimangrovimonas sediminis TaxID=2056283 RepID=UPI000C800265|nr:DUF1656 domain-containing protein [Acidimangrovimonas sediminis]
MNLSVNIYGVFVPALLIYILGGLVLAWGIRRLMTVAGLYRLVWHPALFDLAVIVIATGVVFAAFR